MNFKHSDPSGRIAPGRIAQLQTAEENGRYPSAKRPRRNILRRVWPRNIYSRLTLILAVLQSAVLIAFEIVILTLHAIQAGYLNHAFTKDGYNISNSTILYHCIFIFALVFSLIIAFDTVMHKNNIEMVAFVLFQYLGVAYAIIQLVQHASLSEKSKEHLSEHNFHHNSQGFEITVLVVQTTCAILFTFLHYKLLNVFGWQIYRKIGADVRTRDMYKWYQIMLAFIKFDFFFAVAYCLSLISLVVYGYPSYWINICIGLGGVVIFTLLGLVGIRRESKLFMMIFLGLLGLAFIYLCLFLADMYNGHDARFDNQRKFLTFFVVINMTLIIGTIITAGFCINNFGKGLKEQMDDYNHRKRFAAQIEIEKDAAEIDGVY
ncbi:hypothetical protein BKA69DRAFT_1049255 [Paraphysoderma sedebokerense]|nr:hypothetical protein BKA69DRAFT_1049255 [Paraphysoderma sedebokerense]